VALGSGESVEARDFSVKWNDNFQCLNIKGGFMNNIVARVSNLESTLIKILFAFLGIALAAQTFGLAQTDAKGTEMKGKYAEVNGINLYYETYGTGEPLVLLHGGVGSIEMFGEVLSMLAEGHQVVAVDLQGHGRTADIDRPLSYEFMADDIAALIKQLGFEKADVMGYSLGGGVTLRTAIQYPDVVRRLVLVSTTFKRDGWYPEILAGQAAMNAEAAEPMKQTPLYQFYATIAPRVEDWPVLITKLGELLAQDYDWSQEVAQIKIPTLLVFGDADAIYTSHAAAFFELLGGGQKDGGWDGSGMSKARLAILPGLTHYTIFNSPVLATTVIPFLDAPMPE
jgi:pimeloyl-ACP methyl ester carboxylesterase